MLLQSPVFKIPVLSGSFHENGDLVHHLFHHHRRSSPQMKQKTKHLRNPKMSPRWHPLHWIWRRSPSLHRVWQSSPLLFAPWLQKIFNPPSRLPLSYTFPDSRSFLVHAILVVPSTCRR